MTLRTSSATPVTPPNQRRRLLAAGGSALALPGQLATVLSAALPATSFAQDTFPSRPIRIIVPFPPGQATDIITRLMAERLGTLWKQTLIVDNRGGGGGVPGMMAGKTAAPDGYTWVMGTSGTVGINPSVYASLPYDSQKDFIAASGLLIVPLAVIAHPDAPFRTLQELIALAKRTPGKINFASAGPGTAQHMAAELFKTQAGIDMVHVPYKGSGPALTDLLGGQIPLMFDSVTSAQAQVRSGKLRALAVTTKERVPQWAEVPTIAESGFPGFEAAGWAMVMLPAGTPAALVNRISADVQMVLREATLRDKIIERGSIPDPRTPAEAAEFLRTEIEKWSRVAKIANVRLDN